MTFELLPADRAAIWEDREFTYPDVGATAGEPPAGYHHAAQSHTLPARRDFAAAAADLMSWRVQQHGGLHVAASTPVAEPGTVVIMRLGLGPAALTIPCRVVYVVDEPDRRGFAYGTLPGHQEAGEEAFILQRGHDGRASFTVSAFSRPGRRLSRIAGPLGRGFQRFMTGRYLSGLDA